MLDAGLESLEMFFLNPHGSHRVSIANLMWKSGVEKRGGGDLVACLPSHILSKVLSLIREFLV